METVRPMQTTIRPLIVRAVGCTIVLHDIAGFAIVPLDNEQMVQNVPTEWMQDYPTFGLQARIFPKVNNPGTDSVVAMAPSIIVAVFYELSAAQAALDAITENFATVVWASTADGQASRNTPVDMISDLRELMLQGRANQLELLSRMQGSGLDVGEREERQIDLGEEHRVESDVQRLGRGVDLANAERLMIGQGMLPSRRAINGLPYRAATHNNAPSRAQLYRDQQNLQSPVIPLDE